jgi:hypothetical protein
MTVFANMVIILYSWSNGIENKLTKRFDCKYSRIFSLSPIWYGRRGGFPYFKPAGWLRVALTSSQQHLRTWPVAYHGTSLPSALRILAEGFQRPESKKDISTWPQGGLPFPPTHGNAQFLVQRELGRLDWSEGMDGRVVN